MMLNDYYDYLASFRKGGVTAIYTKVPISQLERFRKFMAHQGKFFKIRYRGPRNTPADIGRGYNNRSTTCLKENATHFSVYNYGR